MNEPFEQVSVGKLDLPNRMAMAPMTRSRAHGGLVTDLTAEYYAQRADPASFYGGDHRGYTDCPAMELR
ncbi:hypothetical protein GCM10010404_01370 [Nonomuraea africana]|uniref:2,4-dienoyl-CoA reductase-like NADH-dependent reductase (Old Yellow Enzyme family) n=1 Tax=Nonomuraea africana TaxID=46171 RepID=A0ABR9KBV4_9ACTN|nr:2,4-dienoyl-CoA reductase-like NADH-dependent reductase (Old Yellow Enzyme family) [Nonomuraea africana]